MGKVIRLTENDLIILISKLIKEENSIFSKFSYEYPDSPDEFTEEDVRNFFKEGGFKDVNRASYELQKIYGEDYSFEFEQITQSNKLGVRGVHLFKKDKGGFKNSILYTYPVFLGKKYYIRKR